MPFKVWDHSKAGDTRKRPYATRAEADKARQAAIRKALRDTPESRYDREEEALVKAIHRRFEVREV